MAQDEEEPEYQEDDGRRFEQGGTPKVLDGADARGSIFVRSEGRQRRGIRRSIRRSGVEFDPVVG